MSTTNITEVKIGEQIWTTRNLDVATYRNGDPIFQPTNELDWLEASRSKTPACCAYDFVESNIPIWGRLYNWYAVNDPRGLAPEGWHIPTSREWMKLVDFLGESTAGHKLKSFEHWGGSWGSNESGFTGFPAGAGTYGGGGIFLGEKAYFWSSDKQSHESSFTLKLGRSFYTSFLDVHHSSPQSIRFIKNI